MAWRRGQAYGQDLRERVLGAAGLSLRAAAARLAVSPSYVAKAAARAAGGGGAFAARGGGPVRGERILRGQGAGAAAGDRRDDAGTAAQPCSAPAGAPRGPAAGRGRRAAGGRAGPG